MSVDQSGGWIPYEERTFDQQVMSDSFKHATPPFGAVNRGLGDLPKQALLFQAQIKATGKLLPRIWQKTGSCVGAAGAGADMDAMCGDILYRNTQEEVKLLFPYATWGIGRKLGNMRGRGDGSYGAVQARAENEWGMIAADDPHIPKYSERDGWYWWTAQQEREYSWPASWPVKEEELRPAANDRQVTHITRVTTWDELKQAFAQGYGVTCASMYGSRTMRVKSGRLMAIWDAAWPHQTFWGGYEEHPELGEIVLNNNQWGPNAHPECPYLSQFGVRGSFWMPKADVVKLLANRSAEIYVRSNTEDWPVRQLDWDSMWMG